MNPIAVALFYFLFIIVGLGLLIEVGKLIEWIWYEITKDKQ